MEDKQVAGSGKPLNKTETQMADNTLNKDHDKTSSMPTDMAELGTGNFDQELTLSLLGRRCDRCLATRPWFGHNRAGRADAPAASAHSGHAEETKKPPQWRRASPHKFFERGAVRRLRSPATRVSRASGGTWCIGPFSWLANHVQSTTIIQNTQRFCTLSL